MNGPTTPISSPPASDSEIFNPNQPMISRKICDPTGVTMEWSRKINMKGGELIKSGFYSSTTVNGEPVIRSLAKMTFHSNEDAYEFGDDTSMLNFIRQKMQLESPNKMDTNCSVILPQGQDPSSGVSVILATSSLKPFSPNSRTTETDGATSKRGRNQSYHLSNNIISTVSSQPSHEHPGETHEELNDKDLATSPFSISHSEFIQMLKDNRKST
ncbi:unnamed protein product [Caenorhabditis brenneri]